MEPDVFRRGSGGPSLVKPWSTERTVCARRDRLAEEREGVERIGATAEEFVGTEGDTEPLPDAPSPVGGCGSTRNDAASMATPIGY